MATTLKIYDAENEYSSFTDDGDGYNITVAKDVAGDLPDVEPGAAAAEPARVRQLRLTEASIASPAVQKTVVSEYYKDEDRGAGSEATTGAKCSQRIVDFVKGLPRGWRPRSSGQQSNLLQLALKILILILLIVITTKCNTIIWHLTQGQSSRPPRSEPIESRPRGSSCGEGMGWSPWSSWSQCSVTCNGQVRVRTRQWFVAEGCDGGVDFEAQDCPSPDSPLLEDNKALLVEGAIFNNGSEGGLCGIQGICAKLKYSFAPNLMMEALQSRGNQSKVVANSAATTNLTVQVAFHPTRVEEVSEGHCTWLTSIRGIVTFKVKNGKALHEEMEIEGRLTPMNAIRSWKDIKLGDILQVFIEGHIPSNTPYVRERTYFKVARVDFRG